MVTEKKVQILGLDFFNGEPQEVVNELKDGGLLVVPAAPALIATKSDLNYYQSLKAADIVIPDSGYMVLLWKLLWRQRLNRISGWKFLITFLADEDVKNSKVLLVDPRKSEAQSNIKYMRSIGFDVSEEDSYLAPMYGKGDVSDPELLAMIEAKKPAYVIINLGGGTQEKLGAYLKANLSYRAAIICTGAAIAFLTGHQASMPGWADKMYLGWLMRCIQKPSVYVPRYTRAFKLLTLMLQYGKNSVN